METRLGAFFVREVKDHRGVWRPAVNLSLDRLATLPKALGQDVRAVNLHERHPLVLGAMPFAFILMVFGFSRVQTYAPWTSSWLMILAVVVVFSIPFRLISRRVPISPARSLPLVLSHGHCPACLYPLHSTPAAEDGCTVCPECQAAWRCAPLRLVPVDGEDRSSRFDVFEGWFGLDRAEEALFGHDARGRAIVVSAVRATARQRDAVAAAGKEDRLGRAMHAVSSAVALRHIKLSPTGAITLIMMFVILAYGIWLRAPGSFAVSVYTLVLALIFLALARAIQSRKYPTEEVAASECVREFLALELCPACARDITREEIGSDGLVECAGCGAAWERDWVANPLRRQEHRVASRPMSRQRSRGVGRWLGVRLRDGRGREVHRAGTWAEEFTLLFGSNPALQRAMYRTRGWGIALIFAVGVGVIALLVGDGLRRLAGASDWLAIPTHLTAVAIAIVFMRLTWMAQARESLWRESLWRAMEGGWCPVCDFVLVGLKPESDGCVVCPECGSAWRMDVATRQHDTAWEASRLSMNAENSAPLSSDTGRMSKM